LKGRQVALEAGIGERVRDELLRRGHQVMPPDYPGYYGSGQVIVRDPATGVLVGGSEPRNDGAAVGW
jgi:gamma-glutamyltranspeptidase/glutathione hydrolase